VAVTGGLTLPTSALTLPGGADAVGRRNVLGVESAPPGFGDDGDLRGPAVAVTSQAAVGLAVPDRSWVAPVRAPISSGFRGRQRPDHDGVDLAAPPGTVVRAAAAGTVVVARCDPATGFCNRGGGLRSAGCGWYVEIVHAGDVLTRYCHLQRRPEVGVGQRIEAGQPIGYVGSSGHSGGPHLHFEVRVRGAGQPNRTDAYAPVDPVVFLAQRRVSLGPA
jgi:murein DD-endopeptidase MepM/ murein hydrolase activator NlpD